MSVKTDNFINKLAPMAVEDMYKTGILASLTIAQAILESGWGESELATKANNIFGIKCGSGWNGKSYSINTKEYFDGTNATVISANFRVYDSWEGSVNDHSQLLLTSRYTKVRQAKSYQEACQSVYECGYATNSNYPQQLIKLIEQYELHQFDKSIDNVDIDNLDADNTEEMYRVRLTWGDIKSQIGAYQNLAYAKAKVDENVDYKVFNSKGEVVYEVKPFEPYLVKIMVDKVPVYKTNDKSGVVSCVVNKGEVFTVIEEDGEYLELKSGSGWLLFNEKEMIKK